eukprot:c29900_g1_i1 orf=53-232(+)
MHKVLLVLAASNNLERLTIQEFAIIGQADMAFYHDEHLTLSIILSMKARLKGDHFLPSA